MAEWREAGWMDGREAGWIGGWLGGWMDGWVDGWMEGWMDGWVNGWMDGWMGGWPACLPASGWLGSWPSCLPAPVHQRCTDHGPLSVVTCAPYAPLPSVVTCTSPAGLRSYAYAPTHRMPPLPTYRMPPLPRG